MKGSRQDRVRKGASRVDGEGSRNGLNADQVAPSTRRAWPRQQRSPEQRAGRRQAAKPGSGAGTQASQPRRASTIRLRLSVDRRSLQNISAVQPVRVEVLLDAIPEAGRVVQVREEAPVRLCGDEPPARWAAVPQRLRVLRQRRDGELRSRAVVRVVGQWVGHSAMMRDAGRAAHAASELWRGDIAAGATPPPALARAREAPRRSRHRASRSRGHQKRCARGGVRQFPSTTAGGWHRWPPIGHSGLPGPAAAPAVVRATRAAAPSATSGARMPAPERSARSRRARRPRPGALVVKPTLRRGSPLGTDTRHA